MLSNPKSENACGSILPGVLSCFSKEGQFNQITRLKKLPISSTKHSRLAITLRGADESSGMTSALSYATIRYIW